MNLNKRINLVIFVIAIGLLLAEILAFYTIKPDLFSGVIWMNTTPEASARADHYNNFFINIPIYWLILFVLRVCRVKACRFGIISNKIRIAFVLLFIAQVCFITWDTFDSMMYSMD